MFSKISRSFSLGFASALISSILLVGVASAATTVVHSNASVPVSLLAYVPCANNGNGEFVNLEGNLHVMFDETSTGNGGVHVVEHDNPQGVTGLGETTNTLYHAVGVTRQEFNANLGSLTDSYVNVFDLIGQGSGANLRIHEMLHLVVDANGNLRVFVDKLSFTCN